MIFSFFLFISGENRDIYRKCNLRVTKETKLYKKFIQCSLKVSFHGQNPQKYKNTNKIISFKAWDFFINYISTLSKLVMYPFTFWYSLASRAFKSQIFFSMHRISNGFKILFFPMENSFFLIQHSLHPPFCWGGGVKVLPNFLKKGVAWQDLNFYRGVAGKEWVTFFKRGCNFYIKKTKIWYI